MVVDPDLAWLFVQELRNPMPRSVDLVRSPSPGRGGCHRVVGRGYGKDCGDWCRRKTTNPGVRVSD